MTAASQVTVISFGYGHAAPPEAHAVYDVRHHIRDPHVRPGLRDLTGTDPAVIAAVMRTPGAEGLVRSVVTAARAFLEGPQPGPVTIAVGCVGGRHRSVVIAGQAAARLQCLGIAAIVDHRDMHRPVIARPAEPGAASQAGVYATDLVPLAEMVNFGIGAWQDFGYENPPAPDCAAIPPLGQRSANAVKAGHEVVRDIDQLTTRLQQVRGRLVSELRQDEVGRADGGSSR